MTINVNNNAQQVANPSNQQYGQYQSAQTPQVEQQPLTQQPQAQPQQTAQLQETVQTPQQVVDANTFISQMPNVTQTQPIPQQAIQEQTPTQQTPQDDIYGPKPYAMPAINIIETTTPTIMKDKTAIATGILATTLSAIAILIATIRR